MLAVTALGQTVSPGPVSAAAQLTVTPLTWNIIGLDSNNVNTGPNLFPVGARVCNSGPDPATNVTSAFNWTSSDTYINLRAGSNASYTAGGITLNNGQCTDFYYEVAVTRNSAAYNHTRAYTITAAADGGVSGSTPTPRELFVEHLVSQNRNAVTNILLNNVPVGAGGTLALTVGATYTITLVGNTATNGYNQLESFINLPNTIFQILSVSSTYSVSSLGSPIDKLYADACGWENNPTSPNYRSCVGSDGKAGGSVTTAYTVKVTGGAGTSQSLNTLLYDFSGSSFHYNSDFTASSRTISVISPASLTFSKAFNPSTTVAGGSTTLTFTIQNPTPITISGINFTDTFPTSPGAMVVASPSGASTAGCGSPTFSPTAGAGSISFSNGTMAPNSTCTVKVNVSAPTAGSYTNTSGTLRYVDGSSPIDTGNTASASLTVSAAPTAPACTPGLTLAQWTFQEAAATNSTPAYFFKAGNVPTASASIGNGMTTLIEATGNPANSWLAFGWQNAGPVVVNTSAYLQFAVDTRNFTQVAVSFDAVRKNNGPSTIYLYTSTDGTNFTQRNSHSTTTSYATYTTNTATLGSTSTTGITYFRIYGTGANTTNQGADLNLDNVTFTGCSVASPPAVSKAFSPSPIAVNGTSTLTFTITNPNSIAASGIAFSDTFPTGLAVASPANASTSGCGSPTFSPTAGASSVSFSGGSLAANGSCTASVSVTATTAGPHTNITDFISSTQGGTNNGPTGYASASLTAILPPVIAKAFALNPIQAGVSTTLTFTITNPNQNDALSGVAFSDPFPTNLTVASPATTNNTCGGTLTAAAGTGTVSLSGGSLAGGSSCTVSVPITISTAGDYTNTTSAVSSTNAGSGNTATATITANAPRPGIALSKQIATSATGTWTRFVGITPGASVYYRLTIENIGDVPLSPVSVTDPTLNISSCTWPATLPVGTPSVDPTATCIVGPVTGTTQGLHTNTATAHGTYASVVYDSSSVSASYEGAVPALTLLKQVSASATGPWTSSLTGVAAGSNVYYQFTITNTGNVDLSPVSVNDPDVSTSTCSFTNPLAPEGVTTCVVGPVTASSTIGTYTNTAAAHGVYRYNASISADSTSSQASYTLTSPDLTVNKTNAISGSGLVGVPFTWTITVTNSGTAAATFTDGQVVVSDTLPDGATYGSPDSGEVPNLVCAINSGVFSCAASEGSVSLAAGASIQVSFSATPSTYGSIPNTAVADPENVITEGNESNNSDSDTVVADLNADLGVTKTVDQTPVTPNSAVTFTVVVSNAGPGGVNNLPIQDPAVTGIDVTSVTCGSPTGSATCPTAPNTTVALLQSTGVVIPSLPSGGSVTLSIGATISATSGSVTNTVEFTPPTGVNDANPENNSADRSVTVTPTADLEITKSNGDEGVPANGSVTYQIVVTNHGPSAANNAVLTDASVAGLTVNSVSCGSASGGAACPTAGNTTVSLLQGSGIVIPTLPSGGSLTFTLGGSITVASGSIANTAAIAPPEGTNDPGTYPNSATDTDAVIQPSADLEIQKTSSSTGVTANNPVTYTVTITNHGPNSAPNAVFTDAAVSGLTISTVTCGSAAGGAVCPSEANTTVTLMQGSGILIPTLPNGGSLVFTLGGTVTATSGNLTNTAAVAPPSGTTDPGVYPNSASDTDAVALPTADLEITKDDEATQVAPNSAISYQVVITNHGPFAANNAVLTDPSISGLTISTVTCGSASGGAVCPTLNPATVVAALQGGGITIATLPSGGALTFTLGGTVTATDGNIANAAAITPPENTTDPGVYPNSATDTDAVVQVTANLGVTKSSGSDGLTQNQPVTYTIVVSNTGPDGADGATLTDPALSGLTISGVTCGSTAGGAVCPSEANTTVTLLQGSGIVIPTLPNTGSLTFTLTGTVTASSGNIANTATVTPPSDVADPTPGNNSATDTDAVSQQSADLQITKSSAPIAGGGSGGFVPGQTVNYQIVVTNQGPNGANGAVLTDPAIAGLTVSGVTCGSPTGGAACPTAGNTTVSLLQGSGIVIPTLPNNGTLTFTVSGTVTATSGSVANTAAIAPPGSVTDPDTSQNSSTATDPIVTQPLLEVTKDDGISIAAPGANLTYTITVTNSGNRSASGVAVTDTLPADLTFISSTPAGTYSAASNTITWPAFALAAGAANARTFSITAQVKASPSGTSITNTVEAADDGSATGGTPVRDDASDTDEIAGASTKTLVETSETSSVTPQVLIGELLTYQISLDVPPGGMANLSALDVLDHGLAFVKCVSINAGTMTTDLPGGFAAACADPTNPVVSAEPAGSTEPSNNGRRIQFNFGSITNPAASAQRLSVRYQVVVLNIEENVSGVSGLNNQVQWTWTGGSLTGSAPGVEIIEARMEVQQGIDQSVVTPGTHINFTLKLKHMPNSQAPAFSVTLANQLPAGLTYVRGTLRIVSGPPGGVIDDSAAPLLQVTWPTFSQSDTAEITFQVIYNGPGSVNNVATVQWSSVSAASGGPQSGYNNNSTPRGYDPNDQTINDYGDQNGIEITRPSDLPVTGFAPDQVTLLPEQPADRSYHAEPDLWLEIPSLSLKMPITGVPLSEDGWDLTWLGSQAGYLEGTTFPGRVGVTGVTGHVTLSNGKSGPFARLGGLRWGDTIILHANGERYTFSVRTNRTVGPKDMSAFQNDGYTWLALITCKNYDEKLNAYQNRVVVRAILTKVEDEPKTK
jgi:LPXTG-site transpeptidase (sortase) family protein